MKDIFNLKNYESDIELQNYSRKSILEEKLKNGHETNFFGRLYTNLVKKSKFIHREKIIGLNNIF